MTLLVDIRKIWVLKCSVELKMGTEDRTGKCVRGAKSRYRKNSRISVGGERKGRNEDEGGWM